MSTLELVELIEKLPEDKKKVVENLVHALSSEAIKDNASGENKKKLPREFGELKGFVKYMADDFDAPLEEFKDYM